MIRGELFFFKSQYVWRIRDGQLQAGYPALSSRHWKGIPDHIDAAYEDKSGNIWFFEGKELLEKTIFKNRIYHFIHGVGDVKEAFPQNVLLCSPELVKQSVFNTFEDYWMNCFYYSVLSI